MNDMKKYVNKITAQLMERVNKHPGDTVVVEQAIIQAIIYGMEHAVNFYEPDETTNPLTGV